MTVDGFERHYAEKLWALVPEVYRLEDGLADNPGVLRSIIEVIATQVAVARRSADRLWEDQSIDTCDDWAVPYIADLIATRTLSDLDPRARRVDVARSIFYRRRRGTPALLEQLVSELTGWDVVLVEGFRRLARTPHRLDAAPPSVGGMTRTPRAGTARLQSPRVAELSHGPFDELYHTPDVRQLRGSLGRLNLGRTNLHLFRLRAYEIEGSTPYRLSGTGAATYTFDPSGRDTPLFVRGLRDGNELRFSDVVELALSGEHQRFDPPRCSSPREWEVEHPMACRLLGDARFVITLDGIANLSPAPDEDERRVLELAAGLEFRNQERLRERLSSLGIAISPEPEWFRQLVRLSMTDDSGRKHLVPTSVSVLRDGTPVTFDAVASANLSSLDVQHRPADPGARVMISPTDGRFAPVVSDPAPPTPPVMGLGVYHYGLAGPLGAGPYERRLLTEDKGQVVPAGGAPTWAATGVVTWSDNRTYALTLDGDTPIEDVRLQADAGRRPYVRLSSTGADVANLVPASGEPRTLIIDGLWLGSAGDTRDQVVLERAATESGIFDWDRVIVRNVTLDPGGVRGDGSVLPALKLLIRGRVRTLVIQRSIVGAVHVLLGASSGESGLVERMIIKDSIVDATRRGPDASGRRFGIDSVEGTVELEGVTVLGDLRAERLSATDSIVMGQLFVADVENSCFRFSAAEAGGSPPKSYRAYYGPLPPYFFTSLRLGDPGYCELSRKAPEALARGAESRSEMGAFSFMLRPIRLDGATAKLDEHRPVGVLPQYIFEGIPARGAL